MLDQLPKLRDARDALIEAVAALERASRLLAVEPVILDRLGAVVTPAQSPPPAPRPSGQGNGAAPILEAAADPGGATCAAPDCDGPVVQTGRGMRRLYCSTNCRKRVNARRRRQAKPEARDDRPSLAELGLLPDQPRPPRGEPVPDARPGPALAPPALPWENGGA